MRESKIERYLIDRVEEAGGTCEKHISPGLNGVPDRLCTFPRSYRGRTLSAYICLVEVKQADKQPTAAQERDHAKRRAMGVDVFVVDSFAQIDSMFEVIKLRLRT